jgi:hypothetical protein
MAYVLFGVPPVYRQASSVVILQPRSEPSEADLAEEPDLESVDPFNPFRGDPTLIVGVVAARLSNEATRESFQAGGLDPDYEVAGAMTYGASRPELEITAFGNSPEQTIETRTALVEAVERQLRAVQKEEGVASYYMVRGLPVEPITEPQELTSRSLRSLLAVGAIGTILLFATVSLLSAVEQTRAERSARAAPARDRPGEDLADRPAPGRGFARDVGDEGPEPAPDGSYDAAAQRLVRAE